MTSDDDLRATIARVRHQSHEWNDLDIEEKTALLDAAERALDEDVALIILRDERDTARLLAANARNAALEEAAQIVDGRVHPDRKGSKIYAVCEAAAYRIRALKEPTS